MPLFLLKFRVLDAARTDCMTLFGGMSEANDRAELGDDVTLVGRWSTVGEAAGFCICRASGARALARWLLGWVPMATITVTPVVDDNQAREIILGKPAPYAVDYTRAGDPPGEDESLYLIEYAFRDGCKPAGFDAFAALDEAADRADAGDNTPLGRWHDLATGTGVAVCSSRSELALQAWAFHWKDLCDCKITPVLTDAELRATMQATPGFAEKRAALLKRMAPRRSWFA